VFVCPVVVVVLLSIHPSHHPSHHPSRSSKFLIPKKEDDERGGGRMAAAVVDFTMSEGHGYPLEVGSQQNEGPVVDCG
jgi:hypothetical protein